MWSGGWKKYKKSINVEGGNVRGGWIFRFKINKRVFTFIREMRVVYPFSQGTNRQCKYMCKPCQFPDSSIY